MEHLEVFLDERFARVTASTKLLLLSHAQDANRDDGATHSGPIIAWMENNLNAVEIPLYGRLPHNAEGQLGVHPAADMRVVSEALSPQALTILRDFLQRGCCIFLGNEPAKILKYSLGSSPPAAAVELQYPNLWDSRKRGIEEVIQKLRPLHDVADWSAFRVAVQSARQTPKRLAAQQETGRRVGKLIRPPASEKKRENCRWVGRIWGGAKKATARSRAASAAVGKISGRRKLTVKQRVKCAEVALRTMSTEEGKARQIQKGRHMVEKRDAEKTKEAGQKGRDAHWAAEGPFAHVNIEEFRAQVEAGVSLGELCHQYTKNVKDMATWMGKQMPPIFRVSIAKRDLSHNLEPETQPFVKEAHKMGIKPRDIAILVPKPVNVLDIGILLGLKRPELIEAKEPMRNKSNGEWLSAAQLAYLVEHVAVDRLARCFHTSGYISLWMNFFERTKEGEVLVNPCRIAKKTAKKQNQELRNNVDIDKEVAEYNAELDLEMRAHSEEKKKSYKRLREEEDALARQRLQERKKARPSAKSSSSSGSTVAQ